ncbi:MAG: UbiA family prenyltransferase [Bacteroidia bacterium]
MEERIPDSFLLTQHNEFSLEEDNNASLLKRLYLYQKERFPLIGHGMLVASFSFSAIAYSRICRGAPGFVSLRTYLTGIFTTVTLFLLVRIFDEFKDRKEDALYRKHLPVPRGLVSLKELLIIGILLVIAQVTVNLLFFPKMLMIYTAIIAYLSLMGVEFFVPEWLKKHQFWYVTSHMFIIPLIDIYASGLDWLLEGAGPAAGLAFFFAVSYMNGIVLEIGRKIRTPEQEAAGVLTYSSLLGPVKAIYMWIGVLLITLAVSVAATRFAGYGYSAAVILVTAFLICMSVGVSFLKKQTPALSKSIEVLSAVWTITMYLTLGGIPMLIKLLFHSWTS